MLENGTKVKHKTLGYEGIILGPATAKQLFTGNTNCEFQYVIRLPDKIVKVAPVEDLEILGAPKITQNELVDTLKIKNLIKYYINKYSLYYLFHTTHKQNIKQILEKGLLSKNELEQNALQYLSIANEEVQIIRQDKQFNLLGGQRRQIHDCVPLYINWRSPTVYAFMHRNNITSSDIVHILVDTFHVLTNNNHLYCFTDGNAASHNTNQFWLIKKLDELDWETIKDNYCGPDLERKRKKNAEFLIYPKIEVTNFYKIVVADNNIKNEIDSLVKTRGLKLEVEVDSRYYTWPNLF